MGTVRQYKNHTVGANKRCGPRTAQMKTSKAEMERVIKALYSFGFGSYLISRMTGYSSSQIQNYARDFQLRAVPASKRAEWFLSLLPADLQADIRKIRIRSTVSHARANAKLKTAAPNVHRLLDDDEEKPYTGGGNMRPEKEVA
jgi:hypothetical protein